MPPRNGLSRALPSAEVDHRVRRAVVEGIPVLLARLSDGQPVAFGTTCPHEGNPLDEARIWCDELDCPYHHYTYDLRTGRNGYPAPAFPAEKRRPRRPAVGGARTPSRGPAAAPSRSGGAGPPGGAGAGPRGPAPPRPPSQ